MSAPKPSPAIRHARPYEEPLRDQLTTFDSVRNVTAFLEATNRAYQRWQELRDKANALDAAGVRGKPLIDARLDQLAAFKEWQLAQDVQGRVMREDMPALVAKVGLDR